MGLGPLAVSCLACSSRSIASCVLIMSATRPCSSLKTCIIAGVAGSVSASRLAACPNWIAVAKPASRMAAASSPDESKPIRFDIVRARLRMFKTTERNSNTCLRKRQGLNKESLRLFRLRAVPAMGAGGSCHGGQQGSGEPQAVRDEGLGLSGRGEGKISA
jgi:hypothetical protein